MFLTEYKKWNQDLFSKSKGEKIRQSNLFNDDPLFSAPAATKKSKQTAGLHKKTASLNSNKFTEMDLITSLG